MAKKRMFGPGVYNAYDAARISRADEQRMVHYLRTEYQLACKRIKKRVIGSSSEMYYDERDRAIRSFIRKMAKLFDISLKSAD